uniref:Uncharacterized protein n=1 Tax=Fagus sylvatica TaxID=28930 RepID=A0A2N9F264_FAGSY
MSWVSSPPFMGFFPVVVDRIFPSWVSVVMRASLSVGFPFPCFSMVGFSSDGGSRSTLPCSIQCGGQSDEINNCVHRRTTQLMMVMV